MLIILAWHDGISRQAEIWPGQGTSDYTAAQQHAALTGKRVYTYQLTEPEPLNRARHDWARDDASSSASLRRWRPSLMAN